MRAPSPATSRTIGSTTTRTISGPRRGSVASCGATTWSTTTRTASRTSASARRSGTGCSELRSRAATTRAKPSTPQPAEREAHMKCHQVDYEIIGDDLQLVEVELDPNETVIAEAGA